jgi:C4-dicarboxylate-specific signal transduction histidine kinase
MIVIGILILGYYVFKNTERTTFLEFNRRQSMMARSVSAGIRICYDHLSDELRTLRSMLKMQELQDPVFREIIGHTFKELQPWGVNDIALIDRDGILTFNVAAPQLVGRDFSWRKYFGRAKKMTKEGKSEDRFITQFIQFKGGEAGKKGLLVAVPLVEKGKFDGVLVITLRLSFITDRFVKDVKSSQQGHAFLVDDQYHVLWSPDPSFIGKNLLEEGNGFQDFQNIVKSFTSGEGGSGEYSFYKYCEQEGRFTDEEEEFLMAYEPVPIGDEFWAVGVWAPKEFARQSIRSVYFRQLLLLILCLLVIAVAYGFALTSFQRVRKKLVREVEKKTGQLQHSHRRLLTILNSLNAVVYAADMESHEILFANKYLREIYGDIEGKPCWQVFHEEQQGPCEFCTNDQLTQQDQPPQDICSRTFESTASGLWHEHRERAVRWVDGRTVRLEIAMNAPCEAPA